MKYDSRVALRQEIGRRIRVARNDAGWSLRELAEHAGTLTASRIGNYEQGTRTPGPDEAISLARALGVSAAWIMCLDATGELSPDERELLDIYRSTDDRGRKTILSVAASQPARKG